MRAGMIYFDQAATSLPKPQAVIEAVAAAMTHFGNANRGGYEATLEASFSLFETRAKLARLFSFDNPERVVFTHNVTEALNMAINGLMAPGDGVITSDLEHNSVLRPLYRLARERGVRLAFLPIDGQGTLRYEKLEDLVDEKTRFLVISGASNVTGNRTDLARLGAFARAHQLIFIVDGAQVAGAVPLDVQELGIDVFCFTGHKALLGPQGTGGLLVRPGLDIAPYTVGGTGVQSMLDHQPEELPTRLEAGTLNSHGIAGLSAALDFLLERGIANIHAYELGLMRRFYDGVVDLPGIRLYGDFSGDRMPIVALNIGTVDSALVSDALYQEFGISTRPGAHCAPRLHRSMGSDHQGMVRFSFAESNQAWEIDRGIEAVRALAIRL